MEKKPIDPNLTIHVKNEELESLLATYKTSKSVEDLNKFLLKLVTSRVLVPANVDPKTKKPAPCLLKGPDGNMFLPVFTSLQHTAKAPKSQAILNMAYLNANGFLLNSQMKMEGVVINPVTDNLALKTELCKKLAQPQQVKLTEAQYVILERIKFEKQFLPKKFFEGKEFFMEELESKKGALLDALYEESYAQKRMYPYLEEDFSVMLLSISNDLAVARIEFPAKDLAPGVAVRSFICWNKATKQGHYFLIERGKDAKTMTFGEVTKELRYVSYGQAPEDGLELQRVLDLVNQSPGLTS